MVTNPFGSFMYAHLHFCPPFAPNPNTLNQTNLNNRVKKKKKERTNHLEPMYRTK